MVMISVLVEPGKCSSLFSPFEKLNRAFMSVKVRSITGVIVKAELLNETAKNITGVLSGVSTVISATYLVAFRDTL